MNYVFRGGLSIEGAGESNVVLELLQRKKDLSARAVGQLLCGSLALTAESCWRGLEFIFKFLSSMYGVAPRNDLN